MRSDIRYLLVYSLPASVFISVALLVLAGLLVWQGAMFVTGDTQTADFFSNALPLLVLLIFGCRLVI